MDRVALGSTKPAAGHVGFIVLGPFLGAMAVLNQDVGLRRPPLTATSPQSRRQKRIVVCNEWAAIRARCGGQGEGCGWHAAPFPIVRNFTPRLPAHIPKMTLRSKAARTTTRATIALSIQSGTPLF